jgi:hypothetical protein
MVKKSFFMNDTHYKYAYTPPDLKSAFVSAFRGVTGFTKSNRATKNIPSTWDVPYALDLYQFSGNYPDVSHFTQGIPFISAQPPSAHPSFTALYSTPAPAESWLANITSDGPLDHVDDDEESN